MTTAYEAVELFAVDTTDCQLSEEEEYAEFMALNISGKDKIAP
jgi:hypothetical protein